MANTIREDIDDLTLAFHAVKCHFNHTDGCGFGYERQVELNGRWSDSAHAFAADFPQLTEDQMTDLLNALAKAHTW